MFKILNPTSDAFIELSSLSTICLHNGKKKSQVTVIKATEKNPNIMMITIKLHVFILAAKRVSLYISANAIFSQASFVSNSQKS